MRDVAIVLVVVESSFSYSMKVTIDRSICIARTHARTSFLESVIESIIESDETFEYNSHTLSRSEKRYA